MRKVALDTNAYTALGNSNKVMSQIISEAFHIGLPVIVLGEIQFGILNGEHKEINYRILERFLTNSRVEFLDINEDTAKLFGEISTDLRRRGRPIQQNDIWIAALCKQYGYKLATNDLGFSNILGLEILNF